MIGRSPFADVVIADASVASHHAELVILDDGSYYLTDCATSSGTWQLDRTADDVAAGSWFPLRQGFVAGDAPLRLGDYRCTAAELTRAARESVPSDGAAAAQPGDRYESFRQRLRGRVERDAATGEIVRRRP